MITAVVPQYGVSDDPIKKRLTPGTLAYSEWQEKKRVEGQPVKLMSDAIEQLRMRIITLEDQVTQLKRGKL